jgi:2-iminoacetate synthase
MPTPELDPAAVAAAVAAAGPADVDRALRRDALEARDLAALLSPAARERLEDLAARSAALTRRRFGRVMQLYAPLYLSNECVNRCTYCGFSQELAIPRRTLSLDEVDAEAEAIRALGFRHLLLVAGEAPRTVDVGYLSAATARVARRFDSISIETGQFPEDGYRRLALAGVDGLTIYQETYLPEVYRRLHLRGPKHSYARRLAHMEAGGRAGFRSLGIGALLGLAPWPVEAFALALHGRALARTFWRSRVAVSFPRIRPAAGGYAPTHLVTDADLVQMICALRIFLPDAELVLSTREPARLRDHLAGLGITRMSAGSRTSPGGYQAEDPGAEQFAVNDDRSPAEVVRMLAARGLEPVWKDFDRAFVAAPAGSAA